MNDTAFFIKNKRIVSFSLIELLIVIAIISILTSLLMPALRQTKEKVRAIVCSANLRQVHPAFTMYVNDFSDYYPPGAVDSGQVWPSIFNSYGYLKAGPIYACPNDTKIRFAGTMWAKRSYNGSYFITPDTRTGAWHPATSPSSLIKCTKVRKPSATVLCYEFTKSIYEKDWQYVEYDGPACGWMDVDVPPFPHPKGRIYLYADGHTLEKKCGTPFYTEYYLDK